MFGQNFMSALSILNFSVIFSYGNGDINTLFNMFTNGF